jgi:hypothetical protein
MAKDVLERRQVILFNPSFHLPQKIPASLVARNWCTKYSGEGPAWIWRSKISNPSKVSSEVVSQSDARHLNVLTTPSLITTTSVLRLLVILDSFHFLVSPWRPGSGCHRHIIQPDSRSYVLQTNHFACLWKAGLSSVNTGQGFIPPKRQFLIELGR